VLSGSDNLKPYGVFVGLDVGKGEHHGCALDPAGQRLYDKPLPNDEAALRAVLTSLAGYDQTLAVRATRLTNRLRDALLHVHLALKRLLGKHFDRAGVLATLAGAPTPAASCCRRAARSRPRISRSGSDAKRWVWVRTRKHTRCGHGAVSQRQLRISGRS
jgi:hypothetical protein